MHPGGLSQGGQGDVPGDGCRRFGQLKKLAADDRVWRDSGRGNDRCVRPGAQTHSPALALPWLPVGPQVPFPVSSRVGIEYLVLAESHLPDGGSRKCPPRTEDPPWGLGCHRLVLPICSWRHSCKKHPGQVCGTLIRQLTSIKADLAVGLWSRVPINSLNNEQ